MPSPDFAAPRILTIGLPSLRLAKRRPSNSKLLFNSFFASKIKVPPIVTNGPCLGRSETSKPTATGGVSATLKIGASIVKGVPGILNFSKADTNETPLSLLWREALGSNIFSLSVPLIGNFCSLLPAELIKAPISEEPWISSCASNVMPAGIALLFAPGSKASRSFRTVCILFLIRSGITSSLGCNFPPEATMIIVGFSIMTPSKGEPDTGINLLKPSSSTLNAKTAASDPFGWKAAISPIVSSNFNLASKRLSVIVISSSSIVSRPGIERPATSFAVMPPEAVKVAV